MKLKNRLAAAMATAILTLGTPVLAAASDADVLREAQDRALIADLMWKYVRALDSLNENAYVQVFTPDGTFATGRDTLKGRDALHKMITDLKKSRAEREAKGEPKQTAMHHIITNATIEFVDKDHARYQSYWMTVFAGSPNAQAPRVAAVGRGIDELVRVNGKWLIQTRNVAPQE